MQAAAEEQLDLQKAFCVTISKQCKKSQLKVRRPNPLPHRAHHSHTRAPGGRQRAEQPAKPAPPAKQPPHADFASHYEAGHLLPADHKHTQPRATKEL